MHVQSGSINNAESLVRSLHMVQVGGELQEESNSRADLSLGLCVALLRTCSFYNTVNNAEIQSFLRIHKVVPISLLLCGQSRSNPGFVSLSAGQYAIR